MVALFVVSIITAFILLDLVIERLESVPAEGRYGPIPVTLLPILQTEHFALPQGMFFSPGHTWAHLLPSGEVKVGADEFTERVLGRSDEIELPAVGEKVARGERIFAVRQGERRATFPAPISGVITSVNPRLTDEPEVFKRDPYHEGWVVALQPTALSREIKGLAVAEEASLWLKRECRRFAEFVAGHLRPDEIVGVTAADGGLLVDGLLEKMNDDAWQRFQQEFLERVRPE